MVRESVASSALISEAQRRARSLMPALRRVVGSVDAISTSHLLASQAMEGVSSVVLVA